MIRKLIIALFCLALCAESGAAGTQAVTIDSSTKRIQQTAIKVPSGSALTIEGGATFIAPNTPQAYGAIGNGSTHPLSGTYGTLAAAQAAYSFTVTGCTFSSGSTTVTCGDATFLAAGYPISGTNIPAATTVASVTDSTHFVLSATPTGSGSSATLTSSYITSLAQEFDYAGLQACVWANGSMYLPAGSYLLGASTLKVKSAAHPLGNVICGAGPLISQIIGDGTTNALRVMQGYTLLRDFSVTNANSFGGTGSGILLDTGATESDPPNYTFNWHVDHVYTRGFAFGIYNPYKWDEGSVTRCAMYWCGTGLKTVGNLDTVKITASDVTGLNSGSLTGGHVTLSAGATHSNTTVNCTSTSGVLPGMVLRGTDLNDSTTVVSVDSATQLTISEAATGTHSSLTLVAHLVGLWVDSDGRAIWSGGVFGGLGYAVYGSQTAGAIITAEDLHVEGDSGYNFNVPGNGSMTLTRIFVAAVPGAYNAFLDAGGQLIFNNMSGGTVYQNGRCDVRAFGCTGPVDVNYNNVYHYAAGVYHTSAPDESPGWPFWDTTPPVGQFNFQVGSTTPVITWRYIRLPDNSLAWRKVDSSDGLGHLIEQAAPGSPLDGDVYKDSTTHHTYIYDNHGTPGWRQLDN